MVYRSDMRSRSIAALSLLLVACSAIANFDGLVSDQDSSDSGVDGASKDGSVASNTTDGSPLTTPDGSSDAGMSSDAPQMKVDSGDSGYCSTHPGHTYCDDFDPTSGLMGRWTANVNLGSAGVGTNDFVSPPREMVAVSPDNDGGVSGEDDIQKSFAATKSMDLEAAIKLTLQVSSTDFMAIEFTPTDTSVYSDCYFDVAYSMGSGSEVEAQCSQQDGGSFYMKSVIAATQPSWDRVHLAVDMSTNQGTVSGVTKTITFPPGMATTKLTALLGVVYKTSGNGNSVVRVDNVFIDTQ